MRGCFVFLLIFFFVILAIAAIMAAIFVPTFVGIRTHTYVERPVHHGMHPAEGDPSQNRGVVFGPMKRGIGWRVAPIPLGIVGILILLGFLAFLLLLRALFGGSSQGRGTAYRGGRGVDQDRLIQQMFHGFDRLGERIEALETILLDEFKKR